MAMRVVKKTAEYTIYERGDKRYAVQDANKQPVNSDEKVRILVAEGLLSVALPPEPEPEVEEAPAAEEVAEEAPAGEPAAEEAAAEEAPAEEAPAEEEAAAYIKKAEAVAKDLRSKQKSLFEDGRTLVRLGRNFRLTIS